MTIDKDKTIIYLQNKTKNQQKEIELAKRIPVPKSVIKQIAELENRIRTLESDVEYYKSHVSKAIIINRLNTDKPTRTGGIPR